MLQTDLPPDPILNAYASELAVPLEYASLDHLEFFESRHPELVASGWMGAGKSRVLCQKAWNVAMRYPGVTIGLFRKAQNSIAATTERTFSRDVVDAHYLAAGHEGRNKSEHWWGLRNGSRIYFLGLDPDPVTGVPSKVGSLDLGWAGVDEAVELSEEDWIMLLGRLRDPRMPWHQLAAATNPGPPKHWLRMRMLENPEKRLFLTIRGNKFLAPEYVEMLAGLPDTAAGRRLGKGEWSAAEGVIWTLPEDQVRADPGPWKKVEAGVDWGFVHAFACEVIGMSGSGRLAVIDEMFETGQTIDRVIPVLQMMKEQHHITTFWADPSEPAYILQCQRAGLPMQPAPNAVSPGIDAVAIAIAKGMTVSPDCKGLLGEIPGYTWAPNRAGGFHEKPIDHDDDACLAAGTMVATKRGPVPIARVLPGMDVWTRAGLRTVTDWMLTNPSAEVVDVAFSDGSTIRCTPDHRLWTTDGWTRADALRYNEVCTLPPHATRPAASGPRSMDPSLRGLRSIIGTAIRRTTTRPTSNASVTLSTSSDTSPWVGTSHPDGSRTWTLSALSQQRGIAPLPVTSYTLSWAVPRGWTALPWNELATTVSVPSRLVRSRVTSGSAPTPASRLLAVLRGWMTRRGSADGAGETTGLTATPSASPAPVRVVGVSPVSGREAVYNLTVEGEHEFYANGVLVKNCDALRYGVVGITGALDDNPWAGLAGQRVGGVA